MKTTTIHTTPGRLAATALAAVLIAACLLAGCSSSTGPEFPHGSDVHYFARTSPDSVVANLRLAYENRSLTHYLDCLAEDFTFYPSEGTLAEHDWIPESWGKTEEIPGPNDGDAVTYEYTFGVDLRVNCQDSLQYVATAPSLFVLQIDPDEVSATEEPLWEIVQWLDIDENGSCGRPVMPTSWGELKAIFLHRDRD